MAFSIGPISFGGGGLPDPRKFQQPINTGPQALPLGTGGTADTGGSPFSSAQQSQLQSALSAAGIWGTIANIGGDVWGTVEKILPKNADGSIDWGGALKDIGSWVKDNKDTILQGLSAVNNYQRTQKSDQYAQQALAGAKEAYDAKAPLRLAGQAGMLNPQANAPDISALRAQGQNGLSIKAPSPLPLATGSLNNAGAIANGPSSGNPFTKALPIATTPTAPPVAGPSAIPPVGAAPPMRSIAPPSHASDVGPGALGPTLPLAQPTVPQAVPGTTPKIQPITPPYLRPPTLPLASY